LLTTNLISNKLSSLFGRRTLGKTAFKSFMCLSFSSSFFFLLLPEFQNILSRESLNCCYLCRNAEIMAELVDGSNRSLPNREQIPKIAVCFFPVHGKPPRFEMSRRIPSSATRCFSTPLFQNLLSYPAEGPTQPFSILSALNDFKILIFFK
jgi:hypothetical protein